MHYEEIDTIEGIRRRQQGPQENAPRDLHNEHVVGFCESAYVLDAPAETAA